MPQVSVIIPVYNAEKTIRNCLKSIFNQDFSNFEIIAVNDGSTDASQATLAEHKDKITIVNQPNQGAPAARNAGARIAQGQYIIFVDSDAQLEPTMLKTMVETLEKYPAASFAYSSFKFGRKKFILWPYDLAKLKQVPYIHTTSLIRREHFPGFDKKLKRFQDWDLWLTMAERGYQGKFIPEILFSVSGGGTMSQWLPKIAYKIPWLTPVKKYKYAKKIIKIKHQL